MEFSARQVSSDKWGIYSGARLLATVGNPRTCQVILSNLMSGRTSTPVGDDGRLYRAPALSSQIDSSQIDSSQINKTIDKTSKAEGDKPDLSDQLLVAELNAQHLKVNEIESAVLAVQKRQLMMPSPQPSQ